MRLFPDFQQAEQDYYGRTGFFPIMHLIGVKKTVCEENPWLPRALYDGLVEARDIAIKRLREVWLGNANRLSLPWLGASMERTLGCLGPDYWSYGYEANRAELDAVCRYSVEQFLAPRRVDPRDLFHSSVLDT